MKFRNDLPIYLQLIDEFKDLILTGEWKVDEKIPSVRELAVTYSVNPNTVQRALTELENQGLLRSERTLGRFVQGDVSSLRQIKKDEIIEISKSYVEKMKLLGQTKDQTIESIERVWV